jgi:hypothetical protein
MLNDYFLYTFFNFCLFHFIHEAVVNFKMCFFQERVRRKLNLEENIRQTSARLERAQLLSYSLEEECKRWKQVHA